MGNILYRLALILYFCITIHRYMKIFNSTQIHELDRYTVEHEPITSLDLMERAAKAIALTIMQRWPKEAPFVVFAGPGNNGGDALAVARLLAEEGYVVSVFLFNIHNHLSDDCAKNKQRLLDSKWKRMFSSHPDLDKRIKTMSERAKKDGFERPENKMPEKPAVKVVAKGKKK